MAGTNRHFACFHLFITADQHIRNTTWRWLFANFKTNLLISQVLLCTNSTASCSSLTTFLDIIGLRISDISSPPPVRRTNQAGKKPAVSVVGIPMKRSIEFEDRAVNHHRVTRSFIFRQQSCPRSRQREIELHCTTLPCNDPNNHTK